MSVQGNQGGDRLRKDWLLIAGLTFFFSFGFTVYSSVFQNFLRDVMGSRQALDLGRLESLREVPGLLAALTAGSLVALAESKVAALGLMVTALGIGASGQFSSYWTLVAITVFWSIGFHLYASVAPAMILSLSKGKEGGRHLGRMNSIGAVSTLTALGLAWLVARFAAPSPETYRWYFWVGGCSIAVSAVLCLRLSDHANTVQRLPFVFRREYGLYYLLTFLEGCRRQIFSIFASFALILIYKVPLQHMLALQFVNAILISVTAPHIGKLIDRVGERGPLTFYSIGLIVVFLGYATSQSVGALYALFLIDNVLFTFGVGFTTYLNRIVRPGELTPCVSMGVTMNHIAAVTVPIGGAYLWDRFQNYQIPFWVGAGIAVIALVATQCLPKGSAAPKPLAQEVST